MRDDQVRDADTNRLRHGRQDENSMASLRSLDYFSVRGISTVILVSGTRQITTSSDTS